MQDPRALYNELVKTGMHPKDAAKEAQARTGLSVVTGKPFKKDPEFTLKGKVKSRTVGSFGQY